MTGVARPKDEEVETQKTESYQRVTFGDGPRFRSRYQRSDPREKSGSEASAVSDRFSIVDSGRHYQTIE